MFPPLKEHLMFPRPLFLRMMRACKSEARVLRISIRLAGDIDDVDVVDEYTV